MPQPPPLYAPRYLSGTASADTRVIQVEMMNDRPETRARVEAVFNNYAQLVQVVGIKPVSTRVFQVLVAAAPRSQLGIDTTAYNLARDMALIQSARAQVLSISQLSGLGSAYDFAQYSDIIDSPKFSLGAIYSY
jgi:hypothetical protein